jgi:hypothetical protein
MLIMKSSNFVRMYKIYFITNNTQFLLMAKPDL